VRFEEVEEGEETGAGVREGGDEERRVEGRVAEHFVSCSASGCAFFVSVHHVFDE
jgi:hypothetical protein